MEGQEPEAEKEDGDDGDDEARLSSEDEAGVGEIGEARSSLAEERWSLVEVDLEEVGERWPSADGDGAGF